MRLGGGIVPQYNSPEEWLGYVKDLGYSAVIFPVDSSAPITVQDEYLSCIRENGLVIGEVGIWKNTLARDPAERAAAMDYAKAQLALAERVGANCCVNISGSFGSFWDGYHKDNYAPETRELIISQTREIIDAVRPVNTYYSLEPMPWMLPDSPDSYLELLRDVDRDRFAVHLDFANMINGLERYRDSSAFIRECFDKLGGRIRSIHCKDVQLGEELPCCLREAIPGEGGIDIALALELAEKLGEDTTVFVEHLDTHEQYRHAAAQVRSVAASVGVTVK